MRRPVLSAVLAAVALGVPSAARSFPVGVTTLVFTKTSVTTGAPRPLATVVWYPAVPRSGTPEALGLRDAAVRRGRHPLVVFSHGSCGRPTEATYLTKALASHGFVVAAPPHVGNTAADGLDCVSLATTVDTFLNRVPDVRFTIDSMLAEAASGSSRFAHRLRADAIGMTGLSFGGFTTLRASQQEPRLRAALVLVPGGTFALGPEDITIPTMVIGAERDKVVGYAESEKSYARLTGPRFLVEVLGANHLSAVDDCFNHDLGVSLCVPADISQDDAHALILHYAVPFVRRYVAGSHAGTRTLVKPVPGVQLQGEPGRGAS
jgi:predicted dienelactone hydrolase